MARKEARQVAMQLIYQYELGGEEGIHTTIEETLESPKLDEDDLTYIQQMVDGTSLQEEKLEKTIGRYAKGWSVERISRVDLAILRLALYEMMFRQDIPESVSINEAVELAHIFSTPEAASFINGILGSVSRAGTCDQEEQK